MKFDTILQATQTGHNLSRLLDDARLQEIAGNVIDGFEQDVESRKPWVERMAVAISHATQVVKEKTFPWPGASSVKYPLVTIACMNFNARAYPALVPGSGLVKYQAVDQKLTEIARFIERDMTFQLREEGEEWEEGTDRMLMVLPLLGCAIKKVWYCPTSLNTKATFIMPDRVVYDYYAESLKTAKRKTHVLHYAKNDLEEFYRSEYFERHEVGEGQITTTPISEVRDQAHGNEAPFSGAPHEVLEQHCWIDLDDDGYEEPYIVHVLRNDRKVLRITPRFNEAGVEFTVRGQVMRIMADESFVDYVFVPSPDGGNLGLGFGVLLGPTNDAVDTLINQLVDAGTLSNLQSGFIAKSIRIVGGKAEFIPGEWKPVQMSGDDLRKGIVPLPTKEPSAVLFNMLTLLIEAGNKVGSAQDILMGENPGQNQPATTTMAVLEQGLKVFNAIYKRCYRSLREEFRLIYKMNAKYGRNEAYKVPEKFLIPAADPNMASQAQRLAKSEALLARAQANPVMWNLWEAERRYGEALDVDNLDTVLIPQDKIQPQPSLEAMEFEFEKQKFSEETKQKWFDLEIKMGNALVQQQKKIADTKRSLATIENQEERLALDAAMALDEAEFKRMKELQQTMRDRMKAYAPQEPRSNDTRRNPRMDGTPGNGVGAETIN